MRQPKENFAAVPIIFSFASFFYFSSCFSFFSPSASAVGATFSLQPRPPPPTLGILVCAFFFFCFYCCRSCCRCQLRFIYNLIIYRLLRGRRDALLLRHVCCVNGDRVEGGENGNGNGKRNVRSLAFDKTGESRGDKQLNCVYAAWAVLRAHANENENKNGNGNGRKCSVGCGREGVAMKMDKGLCLAQCSECG